MIYIQKRICLSCRKFRLEDPHSGVCRVDKTVNPYPVKTTEETCEKWIDGGHQYHIRLGWIKKTLEKEKTTGDK